jgi:cell division protein FtsB
VTVTTVLVLSALVGMGLLAVLGQRLWAQARRLQNEVAVAATEVERVAADRERLQTVVRSQRKAHER